MLPNKLTQRGRPYHSFLYRCEPLTSKKKEEKLTKMLKMKGRVERYLPNPLECLLVLCGCPLGSQESSQSDLKPAKPASFAC
jgi:hypothetical protein